MTPDDVSAIRREVNAAFHLRGSEQAITALCDALEAAWAERDHQSKERQLALDALEDSRCSGSSWSRTPLASSSSPGHGALDADELGVCDCENLRERAERAEAKAEQAYLDSMDLANDRTRAEAALARVRALLRFGHSVVITQNDLRAAIDGPVGER